MHLNVHGYFSPQEIPISWLKQFFLKQSRNIISRVKIVPLRP